MLQIEHFSKTYDGKRRAVDDLTLHVAAGDLFGFLGANGAGKTTTIKAAVGILPFEEGRILVDGLDVREQPLLAKQRLAYIPDDPQLYDGLSGMEYLNFIADIFRVSQTEREARVHRYADMLELTSRLNDIIGGYSHGMKQKLEIVGALLHQPQLLVLDEPFVGLDPKAAFTLKELMREFCAAGGAIFFSTHVLDVAEKLCNKIAVIKSGHLIACGDIESVKGDQSLEEVFLELIDHA